MSQHIPNHDQPAFPFACQGPTTAPEFYYGLTKRERIAAMAMQTIITKHGTVNGATWIANSAVECADALLERLKQSPALHMVHPCRNPSPRF